MEKKYVGYLLWFVCNLAISYFNLYFKYKLNTVVIFKTKKNIKINFPEFF